MIDYGKHITGLKGTRLRVTPAGNLEDTIEVIQRATRDSVPQVSALATRLKGATLAESARNIYDFVTSQIAYKLDRHGSEEIRSAARTWADRAMGVDCEDYSIFIAALALNMGYVPGFEIVDLNSHEGYDHIFAVIYADGKPNPRRTDGYVVDPTPHPRTNRAVPFNIRPKGIRKTMSLSIEYLQGIGAVEEQFGFDDDMIQGLAGLRPTQVATKSLMNHQTALVQRYKQGAPAQVVGPELRKTRWGISLNDTSDQETLLDLWPAIKDVNTRGEYVWHDWVDLKDVADYVRIKEAAERAGDPNATLERLRGLGYLDDSELSGFFKRLKNRAKKVVKGISKKIKNTARKVGQGVSNAARKVGKTVKNVAPKIANAVNKINPVAVGGRVAFLAAVRNNFQNIASNLQWGYLTEAQARSRGFDMSEFANVKEALRKTENAFFAFGGSKEALKRAIQEGGKKVGVSGLGAIPAAILAVINPIIKFIRERVNFQKLFNRVKGAAKVVRKVATAVRNTTSRATTSRAIDPRVKGFQNAEQERTAKQAMQAAPAPVKSGMQPASQGEDERMTINPIVIVAGIGVVAAILFFVL